MERKRTMLAIFIVILLIIMLFFNNPSITGYVPKTTYKQNLNMSIQQSQEIIIKTISHTETPITSLLISGEIKGNGLVNVYLKDENDHKLLVYTNKQKIGSSMEIITGFSSYELEILKREKIDKIETLPTGYKTTTGVFIDRCVQTCSLDPRHHNTDNIVLEAIIEPGTTLQINQIKFTPEKDL